MIRFSLFAYVLFFSLSSVSYSEEPQWIWGTPQANKTADATNFTFRYKFKSLPVEEAILQITCDNSYTVRLNNQLVGKGTNWNQLDHFDISALIRDGNNTITVRATNQTESPAGLVVRLLRSIKGKETLPILSNKQWQVRAAGETAWRPAHELGEFGVAEPWLDQVAIAGDITKVKGRPTKARNKRNRFELVDGDRVIFLGNTFTERQIYYGHIEQSLTSSAAGKNVVFRNLGWSGDNVFGEARSRFGSIDEGFDHLKRHVDELNPTVIFVAYGGNEAHSGPDGLQRFADGLDTLLNTIEGTGAEIVLVGPILHEQMPAPLPSPDEFNSKVPVYNEHLRDVARERSYPFIDLIANLSNTIASDDRITDNGIHLSDRGYSLAARAFERSLSLKNASWKFDLDVVNRELQSAGVTVEKLKLEPERIEFIATSHFLPPVDVAPTFRFRGLGPGKYRLSIDDGNDNKPLATAAAADWSAGVKVAGTPDSEKALELRRVIGEKNQLYFHRWRPQNETYLFLFRKHEQGNNAVEIPQFDPLIAEKEKVIREMSQPTKWNYVLEQVN